MLNVYLRYQSSQNVPLLIIKEKEITSKYYCLSTWWETKRTGSKPRPPFLLWQSGYSPTSEICQSLSLQVIKEIKYCLHFKGQPALLGVLGKKKKKKESCLQERTADYELKWKETFPWRSGLNT